jgi:hypothetical protein
MQVVIVEWVNPGSTPGSIPGKTLTAGLLSELGNTPEFITLVQNEHIDNGSTSGPIGISWDWITDAHYCTTGDEIERPEAK